MKEMTYEKMTTLGGSVKKTLFVAAVAALLLFSVVGSAFAVNQSGQLRLGEASSANGDADRAPRAAWEDTGVPIPSGIATEIPGAANIGGAGTNTYMDWLTSGYGAANAPSADNNYGNSPHGNFTTTTVKCVVCHAVHYAAPGGATVKSDNQVADTLLRRRADEACYFCHATTGQAVNGRPVYNGIGPLSIEGDPGDKPGSVPGDTGADHEGGHITGINCQVCHASVHGANQDHSVAALEGYLLTKIVAKGRTKTGTIIEAMTGIENQARSQGFAAGDALNGTLNAYMYNPSAKLREQAVGVFCAECHNGAYATGVDGMGAAVNVRGSGPNGTGVQYTGHRIGVNADEGPDAYPWDNWNKWSEIATSGPRAGLPKDRKRSSGLFSGRIAWKPATNCKSCHDAFDDFGNRAFPHAWGGSGPAGTKMWLTSAADAGQETTTLPYANRPDAVTGLSTGLDGAAYPQLRDGVCLKCHVAPGATAGVGITF